LPKMITNRLKLFYLCIKKIDFFFKLKKTQLYQCVWRGMLPV
jgi:hypothetical protein